MADVNIQMESFLKGKVLELPFNLEINGKSYICSKVLRLLPRKRLVVKAELAGKSYVIKLFSNAQKGRRELKRELKGYQLTKKSAVRLAKLEFVIDDSEDYSAIAYEFIEHAEIFKDDNAMLTQHAESLLNLVSELHNVAIYQDDFHLENLLIADKKLLLIDLASIKNEQQNRSLSKKKSFENLAMLIVQFIPQNQQILIDKLLDYFEKRQWIWNKEEQEKFELCIQQAWQQRKSIYLNKCFRSCTMTEYSKTFSQQSAFRRPFIEEVGTDFINNIELLIEQGHLLKDGNSATVVKVSYAGKQLVIKRYNIKGFWHWLKRCYRPSRAATSWQNGNLLELLGIATPKALGFIEQRFGWLRKSAYLICEYSDGQELIDAYQSRAPSASELEKLKDMFNLLNKYKVSHGDLKASNLLLDKAGVISLIDLDAMKENQDESKDKARFLKNWKNADMMNIFENKLF